MGNNEDLRDYYLIGNDIPKNNKSLKFKDWKMGDKFFLFIENSGKFKQYCCDRTKFSEYIFIIVQNKQKKESKDVGFLLKKGNKDKDINDIIMNSLKDTKFKDAKNALRIKNINDYHLIDNTNNNNNKPLIKKFIINNKFNIIGSSDTQINDINDINNKNNIDYLNGANPVKNRKPNTFGNNFFYDHAFNSNQIYDDINNKNNLNGVNKIGFVIPNIFGNNSHKIMELKNIPGNINYNLNNNFNQNNNDFKNLPPQDSINTNYIFPIKGLLNVGLTCYMNSTLQCLLHVSELVAYFLNEYPNDFIMLRTKNKSAITKGEISNAFYKLVNGVYDKNKMNNSLNAIKSKTFPSPKYFSPQEFKKVIGRCNPQFEGFSANDSKDLLLYLLQTLHEELNYFGDNQNSNISRPNQYDRVQTFMYFMTTYNMKNFSIISNIFYGTYEIVTKCFKCNKIIYNFQKFEFISFGMFDYKNKPFNIYKGFEDNQKPNLLSGNNQFYCSSCKSLQDASTTSYIIQPPNKLIINIDYGKNKKFSPSRIIFDEEINITKYVNFNFGTEIKYRIIGVCTHKGLSGISGHYIAYCKHRLENQWYKFNDSECEKCNQHDIYKDSPYLLLYERI